MQCIDNGDCGWHANCTEALVCEAFPLGTNPMADAAMGLLSFLVAGISLAAGVGGGGLFVPLLMLVLSFDTKTATALSQSMLIGGALAAFAYNLDHSHPKVAARPLVDFELACLLGPGLMAGAQVGSVLHAWAPPAVVLALLLIVLIDAARKGVANGLKIREKEKEALNAPPKQDVVEKDLQKVALKSSSEESGSTSESESQPSDLEDAKDRISDAKLKLFGVWLFCCAVNVSKGLLVSICSPIWWGLVFGSSACMAGFALYYAFQLKERMPVDEHALDFRELAIPLVRWALLAGVLAALCGIGGGMVIGPILVGLKVAPPVSAATTATTLLLLSSTIAIVYFCRDIAPRDYSAYLSMVTTVGALTGKVLIGRWVRRTGKESVIVWCLAGITVSSTLLMGSLGAARLWKNGKASFDLGDVCHPI